MGAARYAVSGSDGQRLMANQPPLFERPFGAGGFGHRLPKFVHGGRHSAVTSTDDFRKPRSVSVFRTHLRLKSKVACTARSGSAGIDGQSFCTLGRGSGGPADGEPFCPFIHGVFTSVVQAVKMRFRLRRAF